MHRGKQRDPCQNRKPECPAQISGAHRPGEKPESASPPRKFAAAAHCRIALDGEVVPDPGRFNLIGEGREEPLNADKHRLDAGCAGSRRRRGCGGADGIDCARACEVISPTMAHQTLQKKNL
eukprot:scaffold3921_cov127-Isochrysis_galbana.AAC.2